MNNENAKHIQFLLKDGTLNGIIIIEDSRWNSGILYSVPRESVDDLQATEAFSKYGVYLLLSKDLVYVGQSSDLSQRLSQHKLGKDWWDSAVILTTKDDNLNRSDIDYLEYVLIEKAFKLKKLDCDNKKKGNPPKVGEFRRVVLDQYLNEALFLMELIGIDVFFDNPSKKTKNSSAALIDTVDDSDKATIEKRAKAEVVQYIEAKGIKLEKKVTFATLQAEKEFFWLNPNTSCLDTNWNIILNNTVSKEIIVVLIPKGALELSADSTSGLRVRKDNPKRIDLKISANTLIDSVSKVDFSRFEVQRVKY